MTFQQHLSLLSLLLLLPLSNLFPQGEPAGFREKHSVAALHQDLDILRKHLFQVHGGIFTYHTEAEFTARFEEMKAAITEPMTTLEAYRIIGPLSEMIGDSHTSIELTDDYFDYVNSDMLLFPFGVRYLEDRLILTVNLSAESSVIPGSEIKFINGKSAMGIFEDLRRYFERDGFNLTSPNRQLANAFMDYYGLLIDTPKEFTVELVDPDGAPYTITAASEKWPDIEKRLDAHFAEKLPSSGPKPALEFRIEGSTAYMRVRSFHPGRIRGKKQNFRKFFRDAFEQMEAAQVQDFILDIRNNGGGSEVVFMVLLDHLLAEEYLVYRELSTRTVQVPDHQYYPEDNVGRLEKKVGRRLTPSDGKYLDLKDRSVKQAQPKSPHFAGDLYVLINEQSYSAAGDFCGVLQQYNRATFIGAETGGNPYVNTAGVDITLVLPATGLRVHIPMLLFIINNDRTNEGHGMLPDYPVPITVADALIYRDPVLPYTKELIRQKRGTER